MLRGSPGAASRASSTAPARRARAAGVRARRLRWLHDPHVARQRASCRTWPSRPGRPSPCRPGSACRRAGAGTGSGGSCTSTARPSRCRATARRRSATSWNALLTCARYASPVGAFARLSDGICCCRNMSVFARRRGDHVVEPLCAEIRVLRLRRDVPGAERPPIEVHLPLGPGGIGITPTFAAPRPVLMIVESQSPPIQKTPLPLRELRRGGVVAERVVVVVEVARLAPLLELASALIVPGVS